ncbi:hypothetical protein SISNIDRAFT_410611 [Sistotremastrum niveocremeum HHB9708]|uniref:Uncharacterized protein n=2 Tax=Sistotremastraceae TaxID=3402574 RepID=A0A164VA81_9AGAM|nr:hypothetical protein SISNIDRAFT_410611 [Sistotremastrum niveocremeum HHB9708]KZT42460.1 hypothetical protein SISSUDRAFT_1058547 [Sistotremastrum suecicum HHB10207 ss-3]
MDLDYIKLWNIIAELSEHLTANRAFAQALQKQAAQLKTQAAEKTSVFALRRYNVDITKETFESEVERNNAAAIIENQALLHENRQSNALLKEYEQTLETVMAKFRAHSRAASLHEQTLTRHYETLLASRESSTIPSFAPELDSSSPNYTRSLTRLTHLLRLVALSLDGKDLPSTSEDPERVAMPTPEELLQLLNEVDSEENPRQDWATERETEIQRLENENRQLREMLGILPSSDNEDESSDSDVRWNTSHPSEISAQFQNSKLISSPSHPNMQLPSQRAMAEMQNLRHPRESFWLPSALPRAGTPPLASSQSQTPYRVASPLSNRLDLTR